MCGDLFSKNTHHMYCGIFYSKFFKTEKEEHIFKYNPIEHNVIFLVLFLFIYIHIYIYIYIYIHIMYIYIYIMLMKI